MASPVTAIAAATPSDAVAHFVRKLALETDCADVFAALREGTRDFALLDVRDAATYARAHVPGAINLPKGKWQNAKGLAKDRLNVLYCYDQTCHLAAEAARDLVALGYPVIEMEGGFAAWEAKSLPVVTSAPKAA